MNLLECRLSFAPTFFMNAVVIAIAVMFILSLARVSVVLTLVISAIVGGVGVGQYWGVEEF